jgi:hypothetical protein
LAAFAAMREVEIRVRELAQAGPRDIGVPMPQSFAENGPLTDASAVNAERDATMALFWGAIGVFQESTESRLRSRSHGTPLDLPQARMSMSVRRRAGLKVADCPAMLSVQLLADEGLPVEKFPCEVAQSGRRRPGRCQFCGC